MHVVGANARPVCEPRATDDNDDLESIYQSVCEERQLGHRPNLHRLKPHDELFYENLLLAVKVSVKAMLDSGSMACTLSLSVMPQLLHQLVLRNPTLKPTDVVFIECGD